MEQESMAQEVLRLREEQAAHALLELAAKPFVLPSTLEEYQQREVEQQRRWAEEQAARIREQEAIKAGIQARINEQERGSGMKVPDLRSTPGNPHREGRSDDRREPENPHGIFFSNNNISNSADQAAYISDDDTISESATIPDPESDNSLSCSKCDYNSRGSRFNHEPGACILANMMKKNKRRRASHEEEQEQAAKKAATGREHPSMPSTAPGLLDDDYQRRAADIDKGVPSRPGSRMSSAINESSNSKENNTLDDFSLPPPSMGMPRAPLSYVRGFPRDDESRTSDNVANTIKEAQRINTDLASVSVAGILATAAMAAPEATATSEQLHIPTMANGRTRSSLSRQRLNNDSPDLPVVTSDYEQLANPFADSPSKDLAQNEETSESGSEKGYEEPPPFGMGVYDDKSVKELARIEYSLEEGIPELEDSDNDVPDEHNPGTTRRRIADTPEDDYPDPVGGGDMRLAPEKNVYVGAISGKLKNQTPQQYLEARTEAVWLLEIARLKERHAEILKRARGNGVDRQAVGESSPVKDEGDETGASP